MTTVASRLNELTGLTGATFGQHLFALTGLTGVTMAVHLNAYSGLTGATMAEHLLTDAVTVTTDASPYLLNTIGRLMS